MGNFVHHISGGAVAGAASAAAAHYFYGADPADCAAAGVLCCVSSLMPDVDSGHSTPNELMFGIAGVLAPVFALQTIGVQELGDAEILLVALGAWLCVRFVLRRLFKKLTVHRGMFHSIPMALIWGAAVYLALRHSAGAFQNLAAAASALGYFVHLVIDELFSFVNFEGVRISPKESFGTAIKFFAPASLIANALSYILLFVLMYLCLLDAGYLAS